MDDSLFLVNKQIVCFDNALMLKIFKNSELSFKILYNFLVFFPCDFHSKLILVSLVYGFIDNWISSFSYFRLQVIYLIKLIEYKNFIALKHVKSISHHLNIETGFSSRSDNWRVLAFLKDFFSELKILVRLRVMDRKAGDMTSVFQKLFSFESNILTIESDNLIFVHF